MNENATGQHADEGAATTKQPTLPATLVAEASALVTGLSKGEAAELTPSHSEEIGPLASETSAADFAESTHQYVREYIQFADQKAGVLLAAVTAFLAFLYSKNILSQWRKPLDSWSALDLVGVVSMSLMTVAAVLATAVVWPRRKGAGRGLIFFDSVASCCSPEDYAQQVRRMTGRELTDEKLKHCYELAAVCRRKYNTLDWGIRLGIGGILLGIFYLLVAPVVP